MNVVRIIDQALLDAVSAEARAAPRGRRNRNFHVADDAICHRLLNAIEPGSYVAPHRHVDPSKDESIIVLRGRLACVWFDETGGVSGSCVLAPASARMGIDIPHCTFHTVFALEAGTVFFEAKAGPYLPSSDAERASWAPREGDPSCAAYLAVLETALL